MFNQTARDFIFNSPTPRCPFCGSSEDLSLLEVWDWRDFALDACCLAMHEAACDVLGEQSADSAELMRRLDAEHIAAERLRRVVDDGAGRLVLDWNPTLCDVSQRDAKAFVARHHQHCPPPAGWKFGFGVRNGPDLVGVVMVGRPVARMIDHTHTLEVNRLCVRRDLADGLTWNACSMLYAAAARHAKKLGYGLLLTYTLKDESAVSLRASGWDWDGMTRGGSWSNAKRPREDRSPTCAKNRWIKILRRGRPNQGPLHGFKVSKSALRRSASTGLPPHNIPSFPEGADSRSLAPS